MVVTGSADRTVRIWERTDEPFFAEEEKENRIESLFEAEGPVSTFQKRTHHLYHHAVPSLHTLMFCKHLANFYT